MNARESLIGAIIAFLVAIVIVVVLVSGGSSASRPSLSKIRNTGADLSIQVNLPQESTSTYECVPSGAGPGVLPCPSGKLAALAQVLNSANVGAAENCAQKVYVAPEVAEVTGILQGKHISTSLSAQNACAATTYVKFLKLIGQPVPVSLTSAGA